MGFLSYWNFEGYTYVEHFAVTPAKRGLNIGTKMLNHLIREVSPNVLLEVEPPTDSLTEKRIKFYERNGFRVRGEFKYTQPPTALRKVLEMLIMTHGDVSLHNSDSIKEMPREVYNVNHGA